jgi:hypothetical protein
VTRACVVGTFFDNLEALDVERSVNNLLLYGGDMDFGTKSNKIADGRVANSSSGGRETAGSEAIVHCAVIVRARARVRSQKSETPSPEPRRPKGTAGLAFNPRELRSAPKGGGFPGVEAWLKAAR